MPIKFAKIHWHSLGEWPLWLRSILTVSLTLLLMYVGVMLMVLPAYRNLQLAQQTERELKHNLKLQYQNVAKIIPLSIQLRELKQRYGLLTQNLPTNNSISSILEDISYAGLSAGVSIQLIKPAAELVKSGFTLFPIHVVAVGSYAEVGEFLSKLGALPRLVIVKDFMLLPLEAKGTKTTQLSLDLSLVACHLVRGESGS